MVRRPDPRAEPESIPPASDGPVDSGIKPEIIELPKDPPHAAAAETTATAPAREPHPTSAPRASVVTSGDPRLEGAELALAAGDWRRVGTAVGALGEAGKLPPNLGLLCAVAHSESAQQGPSDAEAQALAIRCVAGVMGVPADSRIAFVIAKRIMRKNPVAFRERPAPPARVSALIIVIFLILGSAIGWAAANGVIRFHWHF